MAIISLRLAYIAHKKVKDRGRNDLAFELTEDSDPSSSPIVFLHGMLASKRYWTDLLPPLALKHRLLTLDLLGFGESPKPDTSYSVKEHLTAISQTITQALGGEEKFILAGHSMGAILALNFAIENPKRVQKLILIAPPIIESPEDLKEEMKASSSAVMVALSFNKSFGHFICKLHELLPIWGYPVVRLVEPELPARIAMDSTYHVWEAYEGSLQNILIEQKFERLIRQLKELSILIIAADQDKYMKKEVLQRLVSEQKNITIQWISGGHNFPALRPKETSELIMNFVK